MHVPIARSQAFAEPERFRRLGARPLALVLLPGSVVGTLVVLGGAAAVVVGFFALVLALDRAFPVAGAAMPNAEHSFRRLARERRREARRRPRGEHRLVYLSEGEGWAALAERRRLGVQAIAVDSIVGTVEPEKAAAFDRRFRAPPWTRERWTRMWLAAQRGAALPPISVYRVGDGHFVRDGHHRVSVAAAHAAVAIEADVVELRPREAGLSPCSGTGAVSGAKTPVSATAVASTTATSSPRMCVHQAARRRSPDGRSG